MNKNTNRIKNFWNTIGKGIVALTLSLTLGVTSIVACANSFVKLLERKKVHYLYLLQKQLRPILNSI